MKRFIFFRNDRLGDFLLITNIIKSIKNKYPSSKITVVASKYNYNFIKKYEIIDDVILYNKSFNFLKKIEIFNKIVKESYYASFAVDGKSFSNLCNIFLKSKNKFGLFYKFKFLGIPFLKPNIFNFLFFDKHETFTSKKYLNKVEHLPSKFIKLGNYLGLKINKEEKYFYPPLKKIKKLPKQITNILNKKFILIHLDEKWLDINDINENLYENLLNFQKKINKPILITAFKNSFDYFVNFKKKINKKKNRNIILFEDSSLEMMERVIYNSQFAISCHSGYLVQVSGANNSKIIDIINKKDLIWYSCWVPKNTFHKFVFKSNNKEFFELKKILFDISKIIKK
jgi:ADP-heptose:LPS heptosyltransferase